MTVLVCTDSDVVCSGKLTELMFPDESYVTYDLTPKINFEGKCTFLFSEDTFLTNQITK